MAQDTFYRMQRVANLLKIRVNIRFLKDQIAEGPSLVQTLEAEIKRIERHKHTRKGDASNKGFIAQFNIMPGCRRWIREIDHDALLEGKQAELVAIWQALAVAPGEVERQEEMLKRARIEGNVGFAKIGERTETLDCIERRDQCQ